MRKACVKPVGYTGTSSDPIHRSIHNQHSSQRHTGITSGFLHVFYLARAHSMHKKLLQFSRGVVSVLHTVHTAYMYKSNLFNEYLYNKAMWTNRRFAI